MKKLITVDMDSGGRWNFHGSPPINVRVDEDNLLEGEDGGELYEITAGQARRLRRHYCGISGCTCGSGPVMQITEDRFAIAKPAED